VFVFGQPCNVQKVGPFTISSFLTVALSPFVPQAEMFQTRMQKIRECIATRNDHCKVSCWLQQGFFVNDP
jgi:hypothetical protein